MRIAICFFSYNKDTELLKQALRGVKRLREKNLEDTIDAYVFDDHNAPLEQELLPEWVNYAQTTFDRCRNLNGLECVQGMLSVFADLVSKGYEWVIKADSDTVIIVSIRLFFCHLKCDQGSIFVKPSQSACII